MIRQLSVTEWFARAVAAGLMPECKEITAIFLKISGDYFWVITGGNSWQEMKTYYSITSDLVGKSDDKKITLRSNNKDLYSLEWRKPTKADVGRMCWFWDKSINIILFGQVELNQDEDYEECKFALTCNDFHEPYKYCLLADHGAISPTEADFLKVYGE